MVKWYRKFARESILIVMISTGLLERSTRSGNVFFVNSITKKPVYGSTFIVVHWYFYLVYGCHIRRLKLTLASPARQDLSNEGQESLFLTHFPRHEYPYVLFSLPPLFSPLPTRDVVFARAAGATCSSYVALGH